MKKLVFTFVLSLAGILSVRSQHQNTASQRISLMLRHAMRLNITAGAVSDRIFDHPGYLKGETVLKESVFQVRSNLPWIVTVNTGDGFLNRSSKASAAALGVHLKDGAGYFHLSSSPTSIMVGGQGNSNFNINYKTLPGFNYGIQRVYNVSIVYSQQ